MRWVSTVVSDASLPNLHLVQLPAILRSISSSPAAIVVDNKHTRTHARARTHTHTHTRNRGRQQDERMRLQGILRPGLVYDVENVQHLFILVRGTAGACYDENMGPGLHGSRFLSQGLYGSRFLSQPPESSTSAGTMVSTQMEGGWRKEHARNTRTPPNPKTFAGALPPAGGGRPPGLAQIYTTLLTPPPFPAHPARGFVPVVLLSERIRSWGPWHVDGP